MTKLGQAARVVRTALHVRPRQLLAQARHALSGPIVPVTLAEPPPALSVSRDDLHRLVPFLPAPRLDRVEEESGGVALELVNRRVEFAGDVDWDHAEEGPLWAYHMHQFDFLRGAHVSQALRRKLMLDWIDRHPRGTGWDAHPTSHRALAWGRLLLEPGALALDDPDDARVRASLADQLETLSRSIEVRLQANHLFTNLAAVVFGGLLFEGARADAWLRFTPALERELRSQILGDGMHEERSPMYHSLLLEQVLDLVNITRVLPDRAPSGLRAQLEDAAGRMLGALEVVTHADGEIALFADSGFGSAPSPGALAGYADALGVTAQAPARPGLLDRGGYAKLCEGDFELTASLAGPGPAHQPGHAHCDALSFELLVCGERVVTDTGVYEYRPGTRRDASRRTESHATARVDRAEQAEVWSAHRVGGRPRVTLVAYEPGSSVEATCAGWATRDTVHRRRFSFEDGALVVEDRLEGRARFVELALPLAPGLSAELDTDASEEPVLQVVLASGRTLRVALPAPGALAWRLERTPYFPEFGVEQERWCLFGEGSAFRSGRWVFRVSG